MFSKIKWVKQYGVSPEAYARCDDLVQEGNETSLSAVVVLDALLLIILTAYNNLTGKGLEYSFLFAVAATIVALLYYALRHVIKKNHFLFFYASVECLLLFSIYVMGLQSYSAAVLYPSVVVLLPLFYMHTAYSMAIFLGFNTLGFLVAAYMGPEQYNYLQLYTLNVVPFAIVGLMIHYVYQSNRLRELCNVKENRISQKALEIRSNFETLTKLLRRRAFVDLAEKYVKDYRDQFMAVAILDIDHFKLVNDTYGHQLGDETITKIGQCVIDVLDISLKTPDNPDTIVDWTVDYGNLASRLGGDEFIFLIRSENNEKNVIQLMERLIETLNNTSVGELKSIRGSVGISIINDANMSYDALYHQADTALYTAKAAGRNKVLVYNEEMDSPDAKEKAMSIDALTGALSQNAFKERVAKKLAENGGEGFAMVFFDIDNFKTYNANNGFEMGDRFLRNVAEAIKESYPNELISRFSDDHFVALLPNENLEHYLGKIRFSLRDYSGDHSVAIRTGIYKLPSGDVDVNLACDHAKFACDAIRGRYDVQSEFFDEELSKKKNHYQYIVEHIDQAIENEWIKVYYQPVMRSYTGEVCGFEALARWHDPELGILPPGDFIDTLEQTRLIYKLDLYIVEQICHHYKNAIDKGIPIVPISVNLSQRDFEAVDVIAEIEDIIRENNVPRNILHIEITESSLIAKDIDLKEIITKFRELGYQVWMDDFGSGYSSLNILKDYMFDVIKFDMLFLSDFSSRSREILTAIVDMAKKLGMQTLAEGVETQEQYEFLKSIGCELVQGYLFGKPEYAGDYLENPKALNRLRMENIAERGFYDKVGRVNILSNLMKKPNYMLDTDGSSHVAAIYEYREHKLEFLMATPAYENIMRLLGFGSTENWARSINRGEYTHTEAFCEAIENCIMQDREEVQMIDREGIQILQYTRCLARDERSGKAAMLSVFTDLSNAE